MPDLQPSTVRASTHPAPVRPLITLILCALNILAWCLVSIAGNTSTSARTPAGILHALTRHVDSTILLRFGALDGATLGAGGWWRLLTSQLLHVQPAHLLFNMVGLLVLGTMLEREFGHWRFALLYLAAGTVGQLASVLFAPTVISSGASQAVIGLAGACLVVLLFRPHLRNSRWLALALPMLVWTGLQIALDVVSSGAIKPGHMAGFLAGFVVALLLLPWWNHRQETIVDHSPADGGNR
ncbi:MAG: rhomboid family intramembrane serine protease [Nitrososphaerota archaeon]